MYVECIRSSGAEGLDYDVLIAALNEKTNVCGFYLNNGGFIDIGTQNVDVNDIAVKYDKVARKKLLLHNIQMADATLIFYPKEINNENPLAALTSLIKDVDKPVFYFIVGKTKFSELKSWLKRYSVSELNIIGPSDENSANIYMLMHRLISVTF